MNPISKAWDLLDRPSLVSYWPQTRPDLRSARGELMGGSTLWLRDEKNRGMEEKEGRKWDCWLISTQLEDFGLWMKNMSGKVCEGGSGGDDWVKGYLTAKKGAHTHTHFRHWPSRSCGLSHMTTAWVVPLWSLNSSLSGATLKSQPYVCEWEVYHRIPVLWLGEAPVTEVVLPISDPSGGEICVFVIKILWGLNNLIVMEMHDSSGIVGTFCSGPHAKCNRQ